MSDIELIRHVQRNQCIYDRSVVDYKNPEAKELVWDSIAEKLQIPGNFRPPLSVSFVILPFVCVDSGGGEEKMEEHPGPLLA